MDVIRLDYPFPFAALAEEADRAELHFLGAMHASLGAGDTLGSPGSEEDVTVEFAQEFLGGADVDGLVAALDGQWEHIELDWNFGLEGERIYSWFVPSDSRLVALGVGADELFVVPLLGNQDEGYRVDEWPAPTIYLWWIGEWKNGRPQGDPADTVEALRSAIVEASAAM